MSIDKQSIEEIAVSSNSATEIKIPTLADSNANKIRIELLDICLKQKQLVKAEFEIAQLKNFWPRLFEVVQKVAVPAIVLAAGVAAVVGLPQAKIELGEAKQETAAAKKRSDELEKQTEESKKKNTILQGENVILEARNATLAKDQEASDKATGQANEKNKVLPQNINQVFVHFKGDIARETINGLRATLSIAGFEAPPAERIDHNKKNMVEYFSNSPDEKARATKVAATTREFFEKQLCPLGEVTVEKNELRDGKKAPIELSLNHVCKTTRP
jgi:hypothetical protein